MSRVSMCPGTIDGPEYFQHGVTGWIILPPGDSNDKETLRYVVNRMRQDSRYRDYQYRKVNTLRELDELTTRMVAQEKLVREKQGRREQEALVEWERKFRDRIAQRLASSSTSEYEKEFLRLWMQLRDEKKKALYAQRFQEYQAFFVQREMDDVRKLSDQVING